MVRGLRWSLIGSTALGLIVVLAGCTGRFLAEREPWRHDAEVACLNSGAVKESPGKVRITAINGPGMCGADFPIKVSALGDSTVIGFNDELRPPSGIPNAASTPRWPLSQQPAQVQPVQVPTGQQPYETPDAPRYGAPPRASSIESRPLPPPRGASPSPHYQSDQTGDLPMSLEPRSRPAAAAAEEPYDFRRPFGAPQQAPPRATAAPLDPSSPAYDLSPEPYDRRRVIDEPRSARRTEQPLATPRRSAPREPEAPLPALGPARAPQISAQIGPVSVSPAATLACPIVSALDNWIAGSVQPSAMRWFGQPVIEIKQISAYSCRGMNGNPNANISEHAFGNALDIASFTLADGRRVVVKTGWHGAPEEQGFLRDVQGAACSQFNTVLAPGSNVYHYDHIHVDLMRRNGGRRACNPAAVSGEEIAARAAGRYAAKRGGEPSVTGSVTPRRLPSPPKRIAPTAYADDFPGGKLPTAMPGEDGED
jgi:hypothetical protein